MYATVRKLVASTLLLRDRKMPKTLIGSKENMMNGDNANTTRKRRRIEAEIMPPDNPQKTDRPRHTPSTAQSDADVMGVTTRSLRSSHTPQSSPLARRNRRREQRSPPSRLLRRIDTDYAQQDTKPVLTRSASAREARPGSPKKADAMSEERVLRPRHSGKSASPKLPRQKVPPEYMSMVLVLAQSLDGFQERRDSARRGDADGGSAPECPSSLPTPLFRPETILENSTHRLYHENNLPLFEVTRPETSSETLFNQGPAETVRLRRSMSTAKAVAKTDEDTSDECYLHRHRRPELAEKRARNREIEMYEYARWREGSQQSGVNSAAPGRTSTTHPPQLPTPETYLSSPWPTSRAIAASNVLKTFVTMASDLPTTQDSKHPGSAADAFFSLPEHVFGPLMNERRWRQRR
ncbi:hypothetical protein EV182_000369 [Spiromyces aspiralis]|uniref:Uncharacterized protein n=1 Tax=Spiromyces aspiralis TaxID=68401 RepID=A0ACC1HUI3_9FUNG|nr:hypothetical protein EV182_000369 [Spiromyces aspiralis]